MHTGAWIAGHPAEAPSIMTAAEERPERVSALQDWLCACGVPAETLEEMRAESLRVVDSLGSVEFDFDLIDGDMVPASGGTLSVVHTPGHTPGHLCFLDRDRQVLFTGDHVLPRVSPNISKRPGTGADPLGDYLASLSVLGMAVDAHPVLALPGHEWEFDNVSTRTRQLGQHHVDRLQEITDLIAGEAMSVWETARALPWSRKFASFDVRAKRQAVGETYAHIFRLQQTGHLELRGSSPWRWRVREHP
jgi:glyoxylase-like metal-dependent hydrolase (beta-lactamase superfamily II)